MKINLINDRTDLSANQLTLLNRGIELDDIYHYTHTTDEDILDFLLLGEEPLKKSAKIIFSSIRNEEDCIVIVDSDADGFTSSAILINYLNRLFPTWVKNHLTWFLHSGKQHGLSDCLNTILESNIKLVLIPDAGSNDVEQCRILKENDIKIVILDHHEMDKENEYAVIINNQNPKFNYSNKNFCGAGVVYKFCKFIDSLNKENIADDFLDLCALGNVSDVMDTRSIETKHIINKGLRKENIKNPFISAIAKKNEFKLGDGDLNFMGVAFYISPFVNAIVRSGTQEEKEIVFTSMLESFANKEVFSDKRGHLLGETEPLVEQAIRVCNRVKARQTKAVEKGEQFIEDLIIDRQLNNNRVLLILIEQNDVEPNLRGLIANRLMSKYQKPCAILTRVEDNGKEYFRGSMRGYTKTGIVDFKQICEESNLIEYCTGHKNAAGLSIPKENIIPFIEYTNERLKNIRNEVMYDVDYLWEESEDEVDGSVILQIADMGDIWSSTMEEPLIAIKDIQISRNRVFLYKGSTIKISILDQNNENVDIMIFNTNEDVFNELMESDSTCITIVGRCNMNKWNDTVTPQIFVSDFEIKELKTSNWELKYLF